MTLIIIAGALGIALVCLETMYLQRSDRRRRKAFSDKVSHYIEEEQL